MRTRSFGELSDGRKAGLYILTNINGMQAYLTDYGAALVRLRVPDRDNKFRDVVLGYDDASGYEKGDKFFGATVGRYANRISTASFDLNGRHYILTANDGPNTLHGGRDFYNKRLWQAVIPFGKISTGDISSAYANESMNDWSREPRGRNKVVINEVTGNDVASASYAEMISGCTASASEAEMLSVKTNSPVHENSAGDSITFALDSPDGDQGFPCGLHIEVTYTLTDDNELHIDYRTYIPEDIASRSYRAGAEQCAADNKDADSSSASGSSSGSDADISRSPTTDIRENVPATPLNLTNHSYFNLNGHGSGTVLGHKVMIDADRFTEADSRSIPTGRLLEVNWTPMDFRKEKTLGEEIEADYEPLHFGGGYDHNYVLSTAQTDYREVAYMYSEDSGIKMTVLTDLPGMQLYTANYVGGEQGKDGAVYEKRSAACFETQFWPDTINKEKFPGGILTAGTEFTSRTTYRFSVDVREAD